MKAAIELTAPAKINLFLDVLSKRSDGYHDIITVFEKIDLCDRIRITPLDEKSHRRDARIQAIEISSSTSEIPAGENNIAYRACSLIRKRFGISKGVKIHIEKQIPIAAGLGGGSSDAAAVLKGLNRLWNLNLSREELVDLGKEIGADVPFFIFNSPFAIGRRRGDEIIPIETELEMWHVLLSPPVKVITKEAYEDINLSLTRPMADVRILVRSVETGDFEGIKKQLYNALERVVIKKVTEISSAETFIKKMGFDTVRMTGSGPTIFILTLKRKEAEKIKERLKETFLSGKSMKDWKIFVARTTTATST